MKRILTLGSLFDGSGGFPLAGIENGIVPMWASEIEPYPIAVTKSRFPFMRHLGNVMKIDGGKIPPVDVITFGSPCQDMSVAGKRAGMQHTEKGDEAITRSGLFYEAIRIIREMRGATNGKYPTFAVWENVPGAFSSNKGEDFRCVLQELAQVTSGGVLQSLNLKAESGITPERSWETVSASHGGCLTRNIGECPSAARESTLWQILVVNAPERYYLSAKACQGILNRAKKRRKKLPEMLEEALMEVVNLAGDTPQPCMPCKGTELTER